MGNRSSSTKNSPSALSNNAATEDVSEDESGIFISQEVQDKIVQDFQSSVLKEEWSKRQSAILTRANERKAQNKQHQAELEEKVNAWKEHDTAAQKQLDEQMNALKGQFVDKHLDVMSDVGRLERKMGTGPKFGEGKACLNTRVNLIQCYKENDDIRPCNDIMAALEQCVSKTVTSH